MQKLDVFVKRRLKNQPQLLEILEDMEMFEKEEIFFREILPNLVTFCRKNAGNKESLLISNTKKIK